MRRTLARDKKPVVTDDAMQVVTFQIGVEEYGLDIQFITEIIRPLKITPLPRMPEFVEGVINLRGTVIPIIDLRKRFLPGAAVPNPKTMRMVILRGAVPALSGTAGDLVGFIVDAAKEVLSVPRKDIDSAPPRAVGRDVEFIAGMGKVGGRLIVLLDSSKILSQQEGSALAEVGNAGY